MRKALVLCLEGLALGVAVLAGLFFFAHWKISHGGLQLGFLKPQLSRTLEARLADGSDVAFEQVLLSRDEGEDGPVRLRIYGLKITSTDQQQLLELPELAFKLQTSDLLKGQISPRYIEILNADITVRRRADRSFDFGVANSDEAPSRSNALESLLQGRTLKPAAERLFEGAVFQNTRFVFRDEVTGKVWQTSNAAATVQRTDYGYESELTATFQLGESTSTLAVSASLNDPQEEIILSLRSDAVPVSELLSLVIGPEEGTAINTDLSGSLKISIDYSGQLKGSEIDVEAGTGTLTFANTAYDFDRFVLKSDYSDQDRTFDIETLQYEGSGNRGTFSGLLSFGPWANGQSLAPDKITYDLEGTDMLLNFPGRLQEPLPLAKLDFIGAYQVATETLRFDQLNVDFFGKKLAGSLDILLPQASGQSPGIRSSASFEGVLTIEEVLKGWPLVLADGARRWVKSNVISGKVSDIKFEMDMPRGAIKPATSIGEDSMSLSFTLTDASSYFVPGVTPIRGLDGKAVLGGNSMFLDAEGGRIGNVRIIDGKIEMPNFYPKGSRGIFSVRLDGAIPDILSVVDEEPLGFVSKGGFSPNDFSGQGEFDFRITRPLLSFVPIDDYEFFGSGRFTDLSLANAIAAYDLTQGRGTLDISWNGLDVKADAELQGTPVNFEYFREFTHSEDTKITASGRLDARAADEFGISLRRFMRGTAGYTLQVFEKNNAYETISIDLDLLDAELYLEPVDWRKSRGEPGKASVMVLPPDRETGQALWRIDDIRVTAPGLRFAGEILLDQEGKFIRAESSELSITDKVDLKAIVALEKDVLRADFSGRYLSLDSLMADMLKGGAGASNSDAAASDTWPVPLLVHTDLDTLQLRNNVNLNNFEASFSHDGQKVNDVYMSGNFAAGGYVAATMSKARDYEIGRNLQLQTDNLSALAEGIFGFSSIEGGRADYTATFLNSGPVAGTFTADNLVLTDTPLIARLLAAVSLDGLADLLSGEGIEVSQVVADMQFDKGSLNIVDARIVSPSIGVSVNGGINLTDNALDINGALAPAYQVNSMLGRLPGLGELFVSREGEGIVAFSYALNGPVNEPTITVNTLSLLTPGVFRRLFEPVRAGQKSTVELLDQAISASELSSQLEFATTAEQLEEMENQLNEEDGNTPQALPDGQP
ncbi:AsmA-like C-terminal domain-containing protein [Parvularcula sp. IMCC14364]|uniref:YhdP family protein n=1 Tax=Parvularcula sp. IMCC14364 TaxID=3067902 RepID=UPI0027421BDA|nr:AsmA-like C-terminal domain-containing protein [Parvularcula sp. IMCC14364]